MKNKLQFIILLAFFLTAGAIGASAQNMSNTVRTAVVKFPAGKHQTTVRGTASYAMSYVYNFKVKKGQTITVKVDSKAPDVTFSVFSPKADGEPVAFQVREWSGISEASGNYSITLVLGENTGKVSYSLLFKVR